MKEEKNNLNKNFTKLTQKKGISLIVLIVTIIVIIILAAVVILTISKNNPVESAREAKFKEDIRSFQDDLALTISKEYTALQGQRDNKITTSNENEIEEKIPSFTKEYVGKLVIENDELVYLEDKATETEINWFNDLGIKAKVKTAAEKVAEDPAKYCGQYVTNYTTGHEETKNAVAKWQIFHSDGNNVYLIADDYISYQYAPNGKNGSSIYKNSTDYRLSFNNVYNDYTGSVDITSNSNTKKWISWVDSYQASTNPNIRSVAYMLDTNIWNIYAGEKAEYAIGGPTLEMFVSSYNKTHDTKLACEEMDSYGYKVKIGEGSYNYSASGLPTNGEMNSLYVIADTSKAYAMWLASPASGFSSNLVIVYYDGGVNYDNYSNFNPGVRPLVCLKSNIVLKEVQNGFEIQ